MGFNPYENEGLKRLRRENEKTEVKREAEDKEAERRARNRRNKPSYKRGYRRKWNGDLGKWEYRGGNGFGTFFLSSLSLFMGILIVFNVTFGFGFDGYKTAVGFVYNVTETVGGAVHKIIKVVFPSNYEEVELITGGEIKVKPEYYELEKDGQITIVAERAIAQTEMMTEDYNHIVIWSNNTDLPEGKAIRPVTFFGNVMYFETLISHGSKPNEADVTQHYGAFEGYEWRYFESGSLLRREQLIKEHPYPEFSPYTMADGERVELYSDRYWEFYNPDKDWHILVGIARQGTLCVVYSQDPDVSNGTKIYRNSNNTAFISSNNKYLGANEGYTLVAQRSGDVIYEATVLMGQDNGWLD